MELKTKSREGTPKQIRRKGAIPAVIYSAGREGEQVEIERAEFEAHLRLLDKGCLPTSVFSLSGKKAIVKEIQYHTTTYDILHLDFQELHDDVSVNLNVPIRYVGAGESPGVKLGGILRPVIRFLRVICLPGAIPKEFVLDVCHLNIGGTLRLSDIEIPEGVTSLGKMDEVAVVIAKR